MPLNIFRERMAKFVDDLKSNAIAPGHVEILLPGERAHRAQLRCLQDGASLEADIAADLRVWAEQLEVVFPF
jgi:LDH2 family malate/lactate/ureidoglycolate dehydrogenase